MEWHQATTQQRPLALLLLQIHYCTTLTKHSGQTKGALSVGQTRSASQAFAEPEEIGAREISPYCAVSWGGTELSGYYSAISSVSSSISTQNIPSLLTPTVPQLQSLLSGALRGTPFSGRTAQAQPPRRSKQTAVLLPPAIRVSSLDDRDHLGPQAVWAPFV